MLVYGGWGVVKKSKTNLFDLSVTVWWVLLACDILYASSEGGFNKNFVVYLLKKLVILPKANQVCNKLTLSDFTILQRVCGFVHIYVCVCVCVCVSVCLCVCK